MAPNKKYKTIGLCISNPRIDFQKDFIASVSKRGEELGYKIFIYCTVNDMYNKDLASQGESKIFDLIRYDKLEGLIICAETMKDDDVVKAIISKANEHHLPVICVDKRMENCCNIVFDYTTAFETLVRHIIKEHGCTKINMMAGMRDNDFSEERVECYKRVLRENGIEPEEKRICYGDFWDRPTRKAFDEFMKTGLDMPEAWICANDSMAMTVCGKLNEYGFIVPDDCLVTGFDGIAEVEYHIPRITTAKQDIILAGSKAVDIIARARLTSTLPRDEIMIEYKPIYSHSCGCKTINYKDAAGQMLQPLFWRIGSDNMYDDQMNYLLSFATQAETLDEIANYVSNYVHPFSYQYLQLVLDWQYMNINSFDSGEIQGVKNGDNANNLILVEHLDHETIVERAYYASGGKHFEEALEKYSCFMFMPIHFRQHNIGYLCCHINAGLYEGLYRNDDYRHLSSLVRTLNHVLEIVNNQAVLEKTNEKLTRLYASDYLTGLYNRRGFYSEIDKHFDEAKRIGNMHLCIVSTDMDGLKVINDTYGHADGDFAIKAMSDALEECATENMICARFGGDEFVTATICSEDPSKIGEEYVQKVVNYLAAFNQTSGKPYEINCSYGVCSAPIDESFELDDLVKKADNLMYEQKVLHHKNRK